MAFKILIADDDSQILEVLSKRLIQEGYETVTALDGDDALNKIKKDDPDLIILDIMMPGKNGFDILKEIKSHPTSSKWQPVIIVSAKNQFEDIKKGYDLEADYYITKPCSLDNFVKGVKTMISLIPLRTTGQTKSEVKDK